MGAEMKPDAYLELMDGRGMDVTLARPFDPEEKEVSIKSIKGEGSHTYLLPRVVSIHLRQLPFPVKSQVSEEVMTVLDKKYHVAVLKPQNFPGGFYALNKDINSPYKLIFFTHHGVKFHRPEDLIGELLQKEGLASPNVIHEALEDQKRLRERRLGDIISEEHGIQKQTIENAISIAHREGRVSSRMKIGDILINAGLVTEEQISEALTKQDMGKRKKIGTLLVEKGLITEEQLLMVLAVKFRLRFVNLDIETPKPEALAAIPADVAYNMNVLPLEDDGKNLIVVTSEPTDYNIPETLRFYTKRWIEMAVAPPDQLSRAILKYYPQHDKGVGIDEIIGDLSEEDLGSEAIKIDTGEDDAGISESDSHVVMLVNKILMDAYSKGASDIHFEPAFRSQPFQVRYRIDGTCRSAHQIPAGYKRAIISRLKIMANLDISERRKPQSGKILVTRKEKSIEYRVEISPTVGGNEDAVLRILTSAEPLPLEAMNFSLLNLNILKKFLAQPYGMVLCVGPTGSGKTTTLHSVLKVINTPEKKIWTVEDPVEIIQPGLRQVQVHSKIGLDFKEALRSLLRSDPDVIMVGEMRDAETAKIALEASLTGHLVFSTLHTNSAPETIVRLIEMGMDPFNFSDSLLGILAQRLARRLCDRCKESYHPDKEEYDELMTIYGRKWVHPHQVKPYSADFTLTKRVGCDACNGTGYKGRVAVHEMLANTDQVKQLIRNRSGIDQVKSVAIKEGMRTLLMDGIQKIFQGLTDREEILRVCRYEGSSETDERTWEPEVVTQLSLYS